MVNKYTLTLALVVGVLVLIRIVVDSLKASTLALMALVVLLLLPLVGVALLQTYQLTHGARPQAKPRNDDAGVPAQVIDGNWRELGGYYPQPQIPTPAAYKRNVPVTFSHGTNSRETVLSTSIEGGSELTCPVSLLQVAAAILADGKEPTRTNFNAAGIMSSSEISSAVDFLRAHGWIKPIPPNAQNSPARWVSGADATQLQEFVSTWAQ